MRRPLEATMRNELSTVPKPLQLQIACWFVWFAAYGILGGLVGWTGIPLLTQTVDLVDSTWLKITVLNVAFQLVLMGVVLVSLQLRARRVASWLGPVLSLWIVAHLGVSLAVAEW